MAGGRCNAAPLVRPFRRPCRSRRRSRRREQCSSLRKTLQEELEQEGGAMQPPCKTLPPSGFATQALPPHSLPRTNARSIYSTWECGDCKQKSMDHIMNSQQFLCTVLFSLLYCQPVLRCCVYFFSLKRKRRLVEVSLNSLQETTPAISLGATSAHNYSTYKSIRTKGMVNLTLKTNFFLGNAHIHSLP